MNDAGELTYATQVIDNAIEAARRDHPGDLGELFDELQNRFNPFTRHFDVYASSFCETGDLLSQWRTYGLYAMGFGTEGPIRVQNHPTSTMKWQPGIFRKVEYSKKVQEETIRRIIDQVADAFRQITSRQSKNEPSLPRDFGLFFSNLMIEFLVAFKDYAFHEEQEWRLIHIESRRPGESEIKFRPSGGYVIPYVQIPLRTIGEDFLAEHFAKDEELESRLRGSRIVELVDVNGTFPLHTIAIGPTREVELAERSVRLLLDHSGLGDVSVSRSNAPLRSEWN